MSLAVQRLQAALPRHLWSALGQEPPVGLLALGIDAVDRVLPPGGLIRGAVTEFTAHAHSTFATTLALLACRAGQQPRAGAAFAEAECRWCAFVDFGACLHAPRVVQVGIDLSRLLVVRPCAKTLTRSVLKLTESGVFSVIVVDLTRPLGSKENTTWSDWSKVVRKLSLTLPKLDTTVILITDGSVSRSLPLPVATRIEFRQTRAELQVQVVKDKYGRQAPARTLGFERVA